MSEADLTAERLRLLLHYDPETGVFTWLVARRGTARVGAIAGSRPGNGYWMIRVNGQLYKAHRLAWLYMYGGWPTHQIDHEDTDKGNNRWKNLRPATNGQNQANTKKRTTNTSGFKGVYWHATEKRWRAYITVNRKFKHLGYFDVRELAHAAYCRAAEEFFGEFARGQ